METQAAAAGDFRLYRAGDIALQSGRTFKDMFIAYKTYGSLNADKSNVILYPTSFSAQHYDIEFMVREGGALDPSKYFIIIPNLFGNGLSSSPSNTSWPNVGTRYPNVSYFDAVHVQKKMLLELWGVERVQLVYGWSMGGMQAYHWGALFPDAVERIAVVCGTAKCSPHNRVFIEGVKHSLMADAAYQDGVFTHYPARGVRAMGRVYAGWALSQTVYRDEMWRSPAYGSLEDYLVLYWETTFARRDPSDLLAQMWTWQKGDISDNTTYGGNLSQALSSIRAKTLLMPGAQDLYFRVEDNRREMEHLKNAALKPIPSVWGHRAGNPAGLTEERDFIEENVKELLLA
ncbi:alpha/beta fold hydrolase [Cupriavidus basilensis]|uniref:Alpha/beta fold hydrolase n=1 Tax=Cupriavidus basilensis TaxID=68895 RepID=A0A643FKE4_9BURK|nr:alpha/beta fold hydrolase [Cupriavidus basilensis]QOT82056.1 alpha/beta fold hydrolase [Cupriavidus basilensis]